MQLPFGNVMIIVMNDNKEDIDNISGTHYKNIILALTLTGPIKKFFYQ